jgi:hypothetical protein
MSKHFIQKSLRNRPKPYKDGANCSKITVSKISYDNPYSHSLLPLGDSHVPISSHFCVIEPGDSVASLLNPMEHLKMFHGLFRNHAGMEEGFPVDHPVSSFPNPLGYHSKKLHICLLSAGTPSCHKYYSRSSIKSF